MAAVRKFMGRHTNRLVLTAVACAVVGDVLAILIPPLAAVVLGMLLVGYVVERRRSRAESKKYAAGAVGLAIAVVAYVVAWVVH